MTMRDDYKPGDKVLYSEDGSILRVEVVENKCSNSEFRYRLKLVEVLDEGVLRVTGPQVLEQGHEWECNQVRDSPGHAFGMWRFVDEPDGK